MSPAPHHRPENDQRKTARRVRERQGHRAETLAAIVLRLSGHRILARRTRTPLGEIDLVAVRGRRLAFVEVKRRATEEASEAAVTPAQRDRIRRAANLWLARNDRYQNHEIAFDLVLIVPRRWPRHLRNAL